jgi:hypothetical protein
MGRKFGVFKELRVKQSCVHETMGLWGVKGSEEPDQDSWMVRTV